MTHADLAVLCAATSSHVYDGRCIGRAALRGRKNCPVGTPGVRCCCAYVIMTKGDSRAVEAPRACARPQATMASH